MPCPGARQVPRHARPGDDHARGRAHLLAGRALLEAGDRLEQPGLVAALEVVAAEGARTFYDGTLAESLLALMEERDGLVTPDDLAAYRVEWLAPVETAYAGVRVQARAGSRSSSTR